MDVLNYIGSFLQNALQAGTPILLAILGGILCEKVGNLNLGIEGMMIMGAAFGFLAGGTTQNPFIALLAAGLAGGAGALIYAFITVTMKGNQVVTGLTLTIFGTGVAGFLSEKLTKLSLTADFKQIFKPIVVPGFSKIPVIGDAFFAQSIYVILPIFLAIAVYFYLNKTKFGINTKAIGENPGAADASGINVTLYKYINICIGGALCGLGGAYISLVYIGGWQNDITSGKGWIAVALVIFSAWNPIKAIFAAYAFGALSGLNFVFQKTSLNIPSQILDMLPYVATVIVLVFMSIKKKKENQPPQALSVPYFREER